MTAEQITSRHNPHVKQAIKLREGRQRRQQGRFLIDGMRELERAVAAGIELVELFYCPSLSDTERLAGLLQSIANSAAKLYEVTPEIHDRLVYGERREGVLGVAVTPRLELKDLKLTECPLVAVLEGIEKPGNLGAVLRSADAAGVSAVIVAGGGTDLYNPNAIRASLGTIFSVPVLAAEVKATLAWLRANGIAIFAARVDGSMPYTAADYRTASAIVLGSEAHGLSAAWQTEGITAIKLPMRGMADSLNISATASVLFYEALRQREGTH